MSLSVLFIMFSVGIIMVWTVTVLPRLSSMPFFAFVTFSHSATLPG